MTPLQVGLVQDSFSLMIPRRAEAFAVFFKHLFAAAPETRRLFRGDLAQQSQKMTQVLGMIVDNLDDLGTLLHSVEYLAQRHVNYGVQDEHYAMVGKALIDTLRECLGDSFTSEMERAWAYAYTILTGRMIRAGSGNRRLAA